LIEFKSKHPLYTTWQCMRRRCADENYENYYRYGARGICVCEEWENDAAEFIEWGLKNGWKPGLQIDRIDNSKGYFPSNCRLVSPTINSRNQDLLQANNKTGFCGVDLHNKSNKYQVRPYFNKKRFYLGCFVSPVSAAIVRDLFLLDCKVEAMPLNFNVLKSISALQGKEN